MKKIKVKAKQFINFGLQPDKTLLYFREGETKVVNLTDDIARAIEHGFLEVVKEPKKVKFNGGKVDVVKSKRSKKSSKSSE